jgi:tetratricopeptide (TPR) repeat protein
MNAPKMDHKELQQRLKEDEVAVFTHDAVVKLKSIWADYGTNIVLGVVIVVLLFIAQSMWKTGNARKFAESQIVFGNATTVLQQGDTEFAITQLDSFLDKYGGSDLAVSAKILRASAYAKNGNYDLALKDFQSVSGVVEGVDRVTVLTGIAQTYRSMGNADEAIKEIEKLESVVQTDEMKQQALFIKAGCYQDLGQNDKALELFKSIDSESPWYTLAQDRIDWLEGAVVPPIN